MKALANVNPRDFKDAVEKLRRPMRWLSAAVNLVSMVKQHLARSPAMSATAPVVLVLP
jgi:hypothetical protein